MPIVIKCYHGDETVKSCDTMLASSGADDGSWLY